MGSSLGSRSLDGDVTCVFVAVVLFLRLTAKRRWGDAKSNGSRGCLLSLSRVFLRPYGPTEAFLAIGGRPALVSSRRTTELVFCALRRVRAAARTGGGQMEDEELKNFRRQWRKADKDNSGTLDKKEVVRLVQKVGASGLDLENRPDVCAEHYAPRAPPPPLSFVFCVFSAFGTCVVSPFF